MISESLDKYLNNKTKKLLKTEIIDTVSNIDDKKKLKLIWYLLRQNGLAKIKTE